MKTFQIMLVLLGLVAIPVIVSAQMQDQTTGIAVGTTVPHQLNIKDTSAEHQSFEKLRGEKGLVLVFIRSADWCPYCQAQLIELNDSAAQIKEMGYNIATISYDPVEILLAFKTKYDLDYTLLSDTNSRVIEQFGILNEEIQKGTQFYGIPHPGIFIFGYDGVLKAKLFEKNFKNRPAAEEIIKSLKAL